MVTRVEYHGIKRKTEARGWDWERIKPFAIIGVAGIGLYLLWNWLSGGAAQSLFGGGGAGGGGGAEKEKAEGGGGAQVGTIPVNVQETIGTPTTQESLFVPRVIEYPTTGAISPVMADMVSKSYAIAPSPITQGRVYMETGLSYNPFSGAFQNLAAPSASGGAGKLGQLGFQTSSLKTSSIVPITGTLTGVWK
jgi:hypothetical protein